MKNRIIFILFQMTWNFMLQEKNPGCTVAATHSMQDGNTKLRLGRDQSWKRLTWDVNPGILCRGLRLFEGRIIMLRYLTATYVVHTVLMGSVCVTKSLQLKDPLTQTGHGISREKTKNTDLNIKHNKTGHLSQPSLMRNVSCSWKL